MELRFAQSFEAEYKKVTGGNQKLKKKVQKQLLVLQKNPSHPSLKLHKLSGRRYWSISIDKSIRMLLIFEKTWIYVYHIGKHEEVY